MTANLPVVGGDLNDWGTVLNQYLQAGHNADGTSKNTATVLNVKDDVYGARGDGVANDYTAITTAAAAVDAAGGGIVYFPPGAYAHGTALSITTANPVAFVGAGPSVSSLKPTFAVGDALTVNGPSFFAMRDIAVTPSPNRNAATYLVTVKNCGNVFLKSVWAGNRSGGLFQLDTCASVVMDDVEGVSSNGTTGDTCLRVKSSAGSYDNLRFRTAGAANGNAPCVWVSGTVTSSQWSNCDFAGGGPRSSWAISSIASTGANFTVTTSATHDFLAGDFVAVRGASVAAYNNAWRIASVTATTIVVTSTLNPGAASGGTAESLSACFLVENNDGPCNEGTVTGCVFENVFAALYGTASVYFDGRRSASTVEGWELTGNWYDYGRSGVVMSGKSANGSNQPTCYGFALTGGKSSAATRPVHIDQANGVTVSNIQLGATQSTPSDDGIATNAGIYIYAGPSAPLTQGVTVTGSHVGWPRDFRSTNNTLMTYGVAVDGAGVDNLVVVGNEIAGATAPFGFLNSALAAARVWKIENNILGSGTLPVAASTVLPSVASAATIDLTNTPHETVKITGTTAVSTINGGWTGRRVTLLFTGGLALAAGGNLAPTATRSVQVGEQVALMFDGTSWYVAAQTVDRAQIAQTAAGIISENVSALAATLTVAPATQQVAGVLVGLKAGDIVNGVLLRNTVAAAGTLPTTARFGLADSTGKILALSGNVNALASWGQGPLQFAFTAPYTVLADGGYYAVFVVNGTWGSTQPLPKAITPTQWATNALSGKTPLAGQQTGQTDLPGVGSSLALVATATVYYMGVY